MKQRNYNAAEAIDDLLETKKEILKIIKEETKEIRKYKKHYPLSIELFKVLEDVIEGFKNLAYYKGKLQAIIEIEQGLEIGQ